MIERFILVFHGAVILHFLRMHRTRPVSCGIRERDTAVAALPFPAGRENRVLFTDTGALFLWGKPARN